MSEKDIFKVKLDSNHITHGDTDWQRLDSMTDAEIEAAAISDHDCLPSDSEGLATFRSVPDVATIRRNLNMSQELFARTFNLSLGTLRDWEQRNHVPDRAAQTLLTVIAKNPEAVMQALEI